MAHSDDATKAWVSATPTKAPSAYTKTELLTLMNKPHWDDMFNKKYAYHIASQPVITEDTSFDVSTLNDS